MQWQYEFWGIDPSDNAWKFGLHTAEGLGGSQLSPLTTAPVQP